MKLCAFADEASPTLKGQIQALHRNHIPCLEIRGVNGKNIREISPSEAREIKKELDDSDISVWSIGSPVGKIRLDGNIEAHFEEFKQILEITHILEASRIRMFSFYPVQGDCTEKTREQVLKHIDRLLSLTPDNILLCHENEKDIFGETPENCLLLHQSFPKLRAVFDPANFVQCGVNTLRAWDMLKDFVDYLHIKDAVPDGTVVPAGMGIGNLPDIISDYCKQGGTVMTLEPHLHEFTGLAALENGQSVKAGLSVYKNTDEAFDAGAAALQKLLKDITP